MRLQVQISGINEWVTLGLHKLGKECLGVQLRAKIISQCSHCAFSKILQQISRRPPANKSTRPFHRVFVDWLDLEEGWNSYQGDGALVLRCMVVVCEATGMAVTYFTQSAKEDKNLPLTQDFVTWLALRYNLEVKIIRSDNEMNRIKTAKWCNDVSISFEPCAPDTHAQNGGTGRFGRLIMEKARAVRLYANLPHRLWREIIAAATYLYNRTPWASNDWKSPYEAFHTYVFNKKRSCRTTKTPPTPSEGIRLQSVCADKIQKRLSLPTETPKARRQGAYWLSRRLRVNEYLSGVDTT